MPTLLSLHDVMPATRPQIEVQLKLLQRYLPAAIEPARVTLLVVPGKAWQAEDVRWLQGLAAAGYELAGHGWNHTAVAPVQRSYWHHLHSLMLSRDAAEHLSQSREALLALVNRSFAWFTQHDLPAPALYVPPAWAAGALSGPDWQATPYRQVEVLSGILNIEQQDWRRAAVIGFEADTRWRAWSLSLCNQINRRWAEVAGLPLRVALHPYDHHLYLRDALIQTLQLSKSLKCYADLRQPPRPATA